jgi:hypothetical protein
LLLSLHTPSILHLISQISVLKAEYASRVTFHAFQTL